MIFHIGSYLHKYHDIITDISTYMNFYTLLLLGVGISSKFKVFIKYIAII